MNEFKVKETMEQIHISEEMQEEIIMNIQNRMENRRNKTRNHKKMAAAAAVFVLTTGVVSIPVQAVVKNVVKARMESIPKEEVQEIENMIQTQDSNADGFSRDYSDTEKSRSKALWQAYENGTFPEKEIQCVDSADAVKKGTLCYVNATGDFYLPDREMTDEEILEIIDFQHKMRYAIEQGTAAQEARDEGEATSEDTPIEQGTAAQEEKAKMQEERAMLKEQIQAEGGISEEEAVEIATNQMKSDLGARAEGKEIMKYRDGSIAVFLEDISDQTTYEHKGSVAYIISFGNPSDYSTYTCTIDSADGSILHINTNEPVEN